MPKMVIREKIPEEVIRESLFQNLFLLAKFLPLKQTEVFDESIPMRILSGP